MEGKDFECLFRGNYVMCREVLLENKQTTNQKKNSSYNVGMFLIYYDLNFKHLQK